MGLVADEEAHVTKPVEIHVNCGGIVALSHDVWRCRKCGAAPVPVDATRVARRR